jgi:hypothetical protein
LAGHPAATGTKSGRPPKFNFTNQDIEYLNTFFAALREQPQASRKKRAQMLVSSILKNKHLAGLLANLSEPERESMCDAIAEALDTSPRYAQLVDRLSEGPTS